MERGTALKLGGLGLLMALYVGARMQEKPDPPDHDDDHHAQSPPPKQRSRPGLSHAARPPEKPVTQLVSKDLVVGKGAEATKGSKIEVSYTGWLTNGTVFDSSGSFPFTLGGGNVIPGWDEGVVGMKVGGKRKLVIPPDMGYGAAGQGSIPGGATLVFEIELLKVG